MYSFGLAIFLLYSPIFLVSGASYEALYKALYKASYEASYEALYEASFLSVVNN